MRDIFSKPLFIFTSFAVICGIIFGVVTVQTAQASQGASKSGERLLVIHHGGTSQGILTKATTVRQALKEADIPFDANDLVEPAADEKLIGSVYDVNIYRARPVTIIDGAVRKKIMSAYRTPSQIVKHADMELRDEDITEMNFSPSVVTDGAAIQLTITRATPFTLLMYGKKVDAYSQAKTVGAMLQEKSISLGENDSLSVDKAAVLVAGMTVEIWRDGKQTITQEEDIEFAVEKIQDTSRDVGFKEIVTPGTLGKRMVTYEVEMKNGEEVGRQEIQSVTTSEPQKQVERVGTKPRFTPYTGGGNKDAWLAASVIPRDQWGLAEWLVQKESGWNPNAVNRSSGACGLGQQLPCGKWAGDWNNPVDSLNGMHGYVMGRYGSWDAAVAHSRARGWY